MTSVDEGSSARLDALAQVLIGTFAAMAGLLTLVGANSDRVWVWLDQDGEQGWLVGAGLLAVCAIGLALGALVSRRQGLTVLLLGLASLLYVSALVMALLGASHAADSAGRPSLTEVGLRAGADGGQELSFTVRADSVDLDQLVEVVVTQAASDGSLLSTVLRPDSRGVVQLEATVPLADTTSPVTIRAGRTDDERRECPPPGADAPDGTGPACLTLVP